MIFIWKTQTERRRCIDGDLENQNEEPLDGQQAMKNDPPSELGGHGMSVLIDAPCMIFEMTTPLAAKAQRVN